MNIFIRDLDEVPLLLRRLRMEAKLTLRQVEQACGVPVPTQSQWETGKRLPRVSEVLARLLRFYKVSITLGWEEPKDEHTDE